MPRTVRRVLLLNPPGARRYLRDVYCSHSSKGTYLYHPMDLLAQAALLAPRFELRFIDAIAEGLTPDTTRERIVAAAPDAIVFLSGAVSHAEDLAFLAGLKRTDPELVLVGMGDVFLWEAERFLAAHPWIDGALPDFVSAALGPALEARTARGVIGLDPFARGAGKGFAYGAPPYDLLPMERYRLPFGRPEAFGSLLTSFGCPFHCTYCNTAEMPYRLRELDGVFDELAYLRARGIRKIYVRDPTFALNPRYTRALLDRLIEEHWDLSWNCFVRADRVDEALLERMKRAGCYLVMFGIETASDALNARSRKDLAQADVRAGVAAAKRVGLEVLGTFVLGMPGETRRTAEETIDLARELDLDYASFNVATPRLGSQLRDQLALGSVLTAGTRGLDGSNEIPDLPDEVLSPEEVWRLRNRAVWSFYGRPRYLARRASQALKDGGLWIGARNALTLFGSALG
ncbi:MAG: radical SAM protein [Deltaproteobacteria bacterium]|jgi:anaerobic magnesium-protoporphyrin IX monomethyl ester cyclase|nr:radical SAM protein [Deltaproteobacteria bacterium]